MGGDILESRAIPYCINYSGKGLLLIEDTWFLYTRFNNKHDNGE